MSCIPAFSQKFDFRNYSVSNGLPQSTINDISINGKKQLVIATNGGISVFDGNRFKNYNIENGLPTNLIKLLVTDSEGNIWLGTELGLVLFDGKKFQVFNKNNGLGSDEITGITEDKKNKRLWVSTSKGLNVIYKSNKDEYQGVSIDLSALETGQISCLKTDVDGNIWFGTYGHSVFLILLESNNWLHPALIHNPANNHKIKVFSKEIIVTNIKLPESKNEHVISGIYQDHLNNIWVTDWINGVYQISATHYVPGSNKISQLSQYNGLKCDRIWDFLEDSNGNCWFGSDGFGLFRYVPTKEGISSVFNKIDVFEIKSGLPSNHITSVFEDHEKNIWLGTINSGLSKFTNECFSQFEENWGLIEKNVLAICQGHDSTLWLGTYGGGIFSYQNNKFNNFFWPQGISESIINTIIEDKNGNIWAGTNGGGIDILPKANKTKYGGKDLFKILTLEQKLSSRNIKHLLCDNNNNIWAGTEGAGVNVLFNNAGLKNFQVRNFTRDDGLISNNIKYIYQDGGNLIWICTNGGISKINPSGTPLMSSQIIKNYSTANGLSENQVNCCVQDNFGNMWIGTESQGINVIKQTGGVEQIYTINTKNGLLSNQIESFILDKAGNIWVGTSAGICKIVLNKNGGVQKIFKYTKSEGFVGVECYKNAAYMDGAGTLWFGTINGVIRYIAAEERQNLKENQLNLNSVKIFFHEIDWDSVTISNQQKYKELQEARFILPIKWESVPQNLSLPYYQNHITLEFQGICYSNPDKVKYQFMLEGLDNKWNPITTENQVTYSNLSPGNYLFKVKSCNNQNIWNEKPLEYSFTIEPPFWQTKWFYLLVVGFSISSLIIFIRYRTKSLEKTKRKLEHQVKIRTTEVIIQKEEIEKQKEIIEIKNKDVTDSLNYAKQIQEALLPTDDEIKAALPESFVLFMPQHIVSGDFYWLSQTSCGDDNNVKNCIMLVAADCTGHGVPGALMSMIGSTTLSEIVNEKKITLPSSILYSLDSGIRTSLRQHKQDALSRDGMDIAVCCIDQENMLLHFAGAQRPMYLFSDGVLNEIKGSKAPIGGYFVDEERIFTNNTIKIKKGDIIYLFSDGFIDQFGGEKNKKFLTKNFKSLLTEIHDQPMGLQKMVLKQTFLEWKGKNEQADDILVIGVKI